MNPVNPAVAAVLMNDKISAPRVNQATPTSLSYTHVRAQPCRHTRIAEACLRDVGNETGGLTQRQTDGLDGWRKMRPWMRSVWSLKLIILNKQGKLRKSNIYLPYTHPSASCRANCCG